MVTLSSRPIRRKIKAFHVYESDEATRGCFIGFSRGRLTDYVWYGDMSGMTRESLRADMIRYINGDLRCSFIETDALERGRFICSAHEYGPLVEVKEDLFGIQRVLED